MSNHSIEIDAELYQRAQARASREDATLTAVIETYLTTWVETEPEPPKTATRTWEEIYTVRRGDTLARIARAMYGDARQYVLIAEHNAITNPGMIRVGQVLRIPYTETVEIDPSQGRTFRFPLDRTETDYYTFGSIYAPDSRWAGKPHPGVDFHEREGANVYAIGEGIVRVNRLDPDGYGHYVMIEHLLTSGDMVYSLYGHLRYDDGSFTTPRVGKRIQGENVVIGKEGRTGYAGVPHVHFEIKKTDQLGLYAMLTPYNLREFFYDPYTFIRDPDRLFVPL